MDNQVDNGWTKWTHRIVVTVMGIGIFGPAIYMLTYPPPLLDPAPKYITCSQWTSDLEYEFNKVDCKEYPKSYVCKTEAAKALAVIYANEPEQCLRSTDVLRGDLMWRSCK